MPNEYIQLGYVTNDMDEAVALMRDAHGLGPFKLMRDLTIKGRAGRDVTAHFALAFCEDTQFELIQPLSGDADFYAAVLPGKEFGLRLHHSGRYFSARADYERTKARYAARWPLAIDVDIFGGSYCYFDARPQLGHYLELYSFPEESHFDGVPYYRQSA